MSQLSDAAVEALGGAVGSCIAFGLTYPLQTISTWQSLETSDARTGPGRGNSLLAKLIPSPLQLLYHHALEPEGPSRLYAGIKPFLVGTVISQGLYFYLYATLRGWVVAARSAVTGHRGGPARTQDIGILGSIVVASLAGCINVMATSPVWVIVTQQQKAAKSDVSDDEPRPSALERVIRVYQEGGVKAFWKGTVASLFMVANPTIQFILYEWLISRLRDLKTRRAARAGAKVVPQVTATDAFLMSALAKLGATLATYPMLVVKSRMQAGSSSSQGAQGAQEQQYKSVWDALARIVETEGFQGLFKGMKAKMLQTVLGAALLMAIKEQVYTSIKALRAAAASSRKAAALIKG